LFIATTISKIRKGNQDFLENGSFDGIKYVLIWIVFYPIRKVHLNPIFCFGLKQRSQF